VQVAQNVLKVTTKLLLPLLHALIVTLVVQNHAQSPQMLPLAKKDMEHKNMEFAGNAIQHTIV
jgi:hypothetical protein